MWLPPQNGNSNAEAGLTVIVCGIECSVVPSKNDCPERVDGIFAEVVGQLCNIPLGMYADCFSSFTPTPG